MLETDTRDKSKKYVLIIDANVLDRFSTCLLLQRFGYYIVTANTKEEATAFMAMVKPSFVVAAAGSADLPILFEMQKDPHFSDVPFILLTSSDKILEDFLSRGGNAAAYLRKPVNVEELYRTLQSVIEKGRRRNIRIPTRLTATLEDKPKEGKGFVSDLSEDGVFLQSLEPRPMHARIPISFELMGRTILLEAVVLYRTAEEEGSFKRPGMGMKFDKISPVDRDLIKTYILDHVKEGMSRHRFYNC